MNNTYGINSKNNGYIDTSNSLLGAKNHATRNGYMQVFKRFNGGYHVALASDKSLGYWVDVKDLEKYLNQLDLECSIFTAQNSILSGEYTLKNLVDEYLYKEGE